MGIESISDIRKREIVKAFYNTAIREGLENTSIAKIAKSLEIQPSLIIHYFKSKDELVTALIDHCLELYLQIFEKAYAAHDSKSEVLKSLLHSMFSKDWDALFDDGVYYSAYAMVFREPDIRDKFSKIHQTLRSKFSLLLQECLSSGIISCEEPEVAAHHVFSLVDGTYFYINMLSDEASQMEHLLMSEALALEIIGFKK
ncbi:TetR family transcriptional regulator [Belliella sp. DSM 111904]|uniref:Biofilm operon icaADBC HTH-type negative transcriptional regulator IcaR n=1 Tax=Belliella filtrata TaxID=2923435 RepID=A0ABS9V1V0_9BACT|nr:TetR family transcriptional regulator [Belliella filtrata]MCH7410329.1 TetR family transcriptional regulator [Belliella filtrata]